MTHFRWSYWRARSAMQATRPAPVQRCTSSSQFMPQRLIPCWSWSPPARSLVSPRLLHTDFVPFALLLTLSPLPSILFASGLPSCGLEVHLDQASEGILPSC